MEVIKIKLNMAMENFFGVMAPIMKESLKITLCKE